MCKALSEDPARLYGLFPRKGILRPGSDADIVVYDPGRSHVIQAADSAANTDYDPYEGFVTAGGIRQVWLRGGTGRGERHGAGRSAPGPVYGPRQMLLVIADKAPGSRALFPILRSVW